MTEEWPALYIAYLEWCVRYDEYLRILRLAATERT